MVLVFWPVVYNEPSHSLKNQTGLTSSTENRSFTDSISMINPIVIKMWSTPIEPTISRQIDKPNWIGKKFIYLNFLKNENIS